MKKEKRHVNFEDERGTITDILVGRNFEHATIIFTKKGGIRGNHYHKNSTQYDFYIKGKMRVATRKGSEPIEEMVANAGDLLIFEPNEIHAFEALEDTIFITFISGPRGGINYENDTYRVDPLIRTKVE